MMVMMMARLKQKGEKEEKEEKGGYLYHELLMKADLPAAASHVVDCCREIREKRLASCVSPPPPLPPLFDDLTWMHPSIRAIFRTAIFFCPVF